MVAVLKDHLDYMLVLLIHVATKEGEKVKVMVVVPFLLGMVVVGVVILVMVVLEW